MIRASSVAALVSILLVIGGGSTAVMAQRTPRIGAPVLGESAAPYSGDGTAPARPKKLSAKLARETGARPKHRTPVQGTAPSVPHGIDAALSASETDQSHFHAIAPGR